MSDQYYKPGATIHIVAGMSGRSAYDGLVEPKPVWSAYREVAYGYTIFEATPTSINYKFIRNSDGNVADDFWIINTLDVDLPIEIPNNNTINETDDKNIIDQIKELNYISVPLNLLIIASTAFTLKFRKK